MNTKAAIKIRFHKNDLTFTEGDLQYCENSRREIDKVGQYAANRVEDNIDYIEVVDFNYNKVLGTYFPQ